MGPRDRATCRCLPGAWPAPALAPSSPTALACGHRRVRVCRSGSVCVTSRTLPPTRGSDLHGNPPSPVRRLGVRVPGSRLRSRGRPECRQPWGHRVGPQEVTSARDLPPSPGNQAANNIPLTGLVALWGLPGPGAGSSPGPQGCLTSEVIRGRPWTGPGSGPVLTCPCPHLRLPATLSPPPPPPAQLLTIGHLPPFLTEPLMLGGLGVVPRPLAPAPC